MHRLSESVIQFRENPRLRMGVWIIAVILLVYGYSLMTDYRTALEEVFRQEMQHNQRLQRIAEQQYWPEQAEQARARLVQLQAGLWRADSRGLAQADIQGRLNQQLRQLKLENIKYDVEAVKDVPGVRDVWQVSVALKGIVQRSQLIELLKQIELNDRLVVIRQLDIKRGNSGSRISMVITAYFLASQNAAKAS